MTLSGQLSQLRELVHNTVARVHALEQENAQLRQKLLQYEVNLDEVSQENRNLEKSQQLVKTEVGELLSELQGLELEESAALQAKQTHIEPIQTEPTLAFPQVGEMAQAERDAETQEIVSPEQSQDTQALGQTFGTAQAEGPGGTTSESTPTKTTEKPLSGEAQVLATETDALEIEISRFFDADLGDSLLAKDLSTLASQEYSDDNSEIF